MTATELNHLFGFCADVIKKTSFFLFRGNLLGIFSWFFVLLFYVNGASNFAPG